MIQILYLQQNKKSMVLNNISSIGTSQLIIQIYPCNQCEAQINSETVYEINECLTIYFSHQTLFMFLRKYSHNIYKVQVVLFLVFIFLATVYYNYPQAHRFFNRMWYENSCFCFDYLFSAIMTILFACFFLDNLGLSSCLSVFFVLYENGLEKACNITNSLPNKLCL